MKTVIFFLLAGFITGCSSTPRTKWSDKSMRVMIDPDSIDEENYVQVLQALVQSEKFTVVDRSRGWKAAKKEQERLHQGSEAGRYEDKEKWAHWAKLYGVGAIVVANAQCQKANAFLSQTKTKLYCMQHLHMVDANTGEVIVAADGDNDGPSTYGREYIMPDWNEVVGKLVESYPKNYTSQAYTKEVLDYQALSKEHAQRQRERQEAERTPASAPALPTE